MQIRILLYWRNWKSFLSSVYTIKEAMCDERALTKQRVDGHLKRRMCVVLWPFKIPRQECRRTFYSVVYYQQAMTFFELSAASTKGCTREGISLALKLANYCLVWALFFSYLYFIFIWAAAKPSAHCQISKRFRWFVSTFGVIKEFEDSMTTSLVIWELMFC